MNPFPESLDRMSEIVFVIVFWSNKLLVVCIYNCQVAKLLFWLAKKKKQLYGTSPHHKSCLGLEGETWWCQLWYLAWAATECERVGSQDWRFGAAAKLWTFFEIAGDQMCFYFYLRNIMFWITNHIGIYLYWHWHWYRRHMRGNFSLTARIIVALCLIFYF